MEIDLTKHKIFLLSVLDPEGGRCDEAEHLIQPFATKGFRFFNQVIFVTSNSSIEITEHLAKKKSEKFQFFLIDITSNLDQGTFVGVLKKKFFPIAEDALKIISAFKPIMPELNDEQKANMIFDKIGQDGADSLSPKEKLFLETFQGFK